MMEPDMEPQETVPREGKKKWWSPMRRKKRSSKKKKERSVEAETFSEPVEQAPYYPVSKDGVPVVSAANADVFHPSDVHQTDIVDAQGRKTHPRSSAHERVVLDAPPAARDSAFSGPPRYDWIDIETAAAIKVQSVYRRNKVMSEMEADGKTTAAIRNKSRRRKAPSFLSSTDDAPGLFQCCGVGLIFGDATEDDGDADKEFARTRYEQKKRQKAENDARLRKYRPRAKTEQKIQESIEIVE